MATVNAETIINKAKTFVGTKESPKNSNNVIFNTHYYGKAVSGSAYPWCCTFIWDIFRMCGASSLFYDGNKCAYTPTLASWFKSKKAFYNTPKVGDIVFFQFAGSNRICHVGIVIEIISKTKIRTIEGNTSSSNDANGGAVEIRERPNTYIVGYGRPSYGNDKASDPKPVVSAYSYTDFVKDVQKILKFTVTGRADATLLSKTVTLSKTKNNKHPLVLPVQKYLNSLGYNCGTPDSNFGPNTDKAVKKFQNWMKNPDGEITAKGRTWKTLLKL